MLKDQKPHWMAKGPYFSEIHFKIVIGEKDFIWVFGEGDAKNPLEQAIFFIDYNAKAAITPDPIRNGTIYTPTPNRARWTKITKMGNNAVHLYELPKGELILSIANDEQPGKSAKNAATMVSHIIMWP